MTHFLPAICVSTFLSSSKNLSQAKKESLSRLQIQAGLNSSSTKTVAIQEKTCPVAPAAFGLRLVIFSLVNDSNQTLCLNQNLKVRVGDTGTEAVALSHSWLSAKQQNFVFFLHQLLQERISGVADNQQADDIQNSSLSGIMVTNLSSQHISAELQKINLYGKVLAPGQCFSGILLIPASSSDPIRFYLNQV